MARLYQGVLTYLSKVDPTKLGRTPVRTMRRNDFTVGWICALSHELAASKAMLDETYDRIEDSVDAGDNNTYLWGRIGDHQVVMAALPAGKYGNDSSATVARDMLRSFKSIRFGLMVGIGGGIPDRNNDIRLGDVVVSKPTETSGGVIQYDFGKREADGSFKRRGQLNKPPLVLLSALQVLQARHELEGSQLINNLKRMKQKYPRNSNDYAFPGAEKDQAYITDCEHKDPYCKECGPHEMLDRRPRKYGSEPKIHYGLIASGNSVIASAKERERLRKDGDILCFEMEAAGMMDSFPCLIVRGICDYADAYKRDEWQRYAALVAAAYGRELLSVISATAIERTDTAVTATRKSESNICSQML